MKAIWNNTIIAENDAIVVVENNHYFPHENVKQEYVMPSIAHTTCLWKGKASYYNLEVDGKQNIDAAWYYPEVSENAEAIKNHVAFWGGVQIEP